MKSRFSIWLPVGQQIKSKLELVIKDLSKLYGGPIFEPHLTLLGDIPNDKEEMLRSSKKLSAKLKPFKIELGEVSFSTTYFQSVFVRAVAKAPLLKANLLAKKIFKAENNVFMPHISLLYGNHSMKTREEALTKIKLPQDRYMVNKLIVTPSTSDPKDWIHLAEYTFSK